jgi:hypothetical protein
MLHWAPLPALVCRYEELGFCAMQRKESFCAEKAEEANTALCTARRMSPSGARGGALEGIESQDDSERGGAVQRL